MPECVHLLECDFLAGVPEAESIEQQYCRGAHADCARRIASTVLGRVAVPPTLSPDDTEQLGQLLNAAGRNLPGMYGG